MAIKLSADFMVWGLGIEFDFLIRSLIVQMGPFYLFAVWSRRRNHHWQPLQSKAA
jgi:hypothetical protein